ncbi:OLC1v1017994C1 [Oldenlandia corymbosa var. corymbosa]|uniref:OLC1v1017994C1 n=1 Tax=Oldenlandia corymbosa var. corymbosa TaxID=529605 RepID=A0AAV1EAL2_OLDCO|nr:OLC1v1017994C1 [Oldenlandia corymbosa var. corymbosa]
MAPELKPVKAVVASSHVAKGVNTPVSPTKDVDDGNVTARSDPAIISSASETFALDVPIVNIVVSPTNYADYGNATVPSDAAINPSVNVAPAPTVPILVAQRYIADINGLIHTKSIPFIIVVRVMTLCKVPESSKSNKVNPMEMPLVDAHGSKIQATILGRYVKDFVDFFREGCIRRLSRFNHALNISGGFRCAKHEYKIVFESNTLVDSVIDFDIDIPFHVFEFTPFAEVTNFVANFDYCFDLIGHLIAYSDPIVDYGKKRISVELEDERADMLKCKKYYSKASVTTNLLNGIIYLADMTMPDISGYKDRAFDDEIKQASIQKISLMSSISRYTTYEDFISGTSLLSLTDIEDVDEPGYVVIFAKITGLTKEFDWPYISCRDCNKKSKKLRMFKLQVYVRDDSGSRIVTLWDMMVYNFINKTAKNLREQEGKDYPKVLDELVGKKCLFKLDVSNFNIQNSNREISAISSTFYFMQTKYQEIDPEMSTEFYQNLTPTQDSTGKTAISCTDDAYMGFSGDDMADSPPPKNKIAASGYEECQIQCQQACQEAVMMIKSESIFYFR